MMLSVVDVSLCFGVDFGFVSVWLYLQKRLLGHHKGFHVSMSFFENLMLLGKEKLAVRIQLAVCLYNVLIILVVPGW